MKDYETEVRAGRLTVNAPKKTLQGIHILAQTQGISANELVVRLFDNVVNRNAELIERIENERKQQSKLIKLFDSGDDGDEGKKKSAE